MKKFNIGDLVKVTWWPFSGASMRVSIGIVSGELTQASVNGADWWDAYPVEVEWGKSTVREMISPNYMELL